MIIEPRPMEKGWIKRTLIGALRLILRAPAQWFVFCVGLPVLMIYLPLIALKALLWVGVGFGSLVLAFQCDKLEDLTITDAIIIFQRNPQYVVLELSGLLLLFSVFDVLLYDTIHEWLNHYFVTGVVLLLLEIAIAIVFFVFFMFWQLPKASAYMREQGKSLDDLESFISYPNIFAVYLLFDTDLSWHDACLLGIKGFDAMGTQKYVFFAFPMTIIIFPPMTILVFPWMYCVYKEVFWQEGIKAKAKAKRMAENSAHAPA